MSEIKDYLAEIGRRGGQKSKGGGRPPTYKTEKERKLARREAQKRYRQRQKEKNNAAEKNDQEDRMETV